MASRGHAFTAFAKNKIIACGGLLESHAYRATAWMLFEGGHPEHFIAIHRATLHVLNTASYKVVDAFVNPLKPTAVRWIKMLGFELVQPYKPFFFPDGSGASEWIRYAEGKQ